MLITSLNREIFIYSEIDISIFSNRDISIDLGTVNRFQEEKKNTRQNIWLLRNAVSCYGIDWVVLKI